MHKYVKVPIDEYLELFNNMLFLDTLEVEGVYIRDIYNYSDYEEVTESEIDLEIIEE